MKDSRRFRIVPNARPDHRCRPNTISPFLPHLVNLGGRSSFGSLWRPAPELPVFARRSGLPLRFHRPTACWAKADQVNSMDRTFWHFFWTLLPPTLARHAGILNG